MPEIWIYYTDLLLFFDPSKGDNFQNICLTQSNKFKGQGMGEGILRIVF